MQQVATYEAVVKAAEELEAKGQKATGDAVVLMIGGSKGTVLAHLRTWRRRGNSESVPMSKEIPADFQTALVRFIGQVEEQAVANLQREITAAEAGEADAIDGLRKAESRIEMLTTELEALRKSAADYRQQAEKAAAVAGQEIQDLRARLDALEIERRQLIEAGESARTEAAKALLQVERADRAAEKAEGRVRELAGQVEELISTNAEADKRMAVAERHAQDLVDQVAKLEKRLEKNSAKVELVESERDALRVSLEAARKETAAADKRAALAEQKQALLEKPVKKEGKEKGQVVQQK